MWNFIAERAKAFMASFVAGIVTAFFTSLQSAGIPVPPEMQASALAFITGLFVSHTANRPVTLFDSKSMGWGSNFKEWVLQIMSGLVAYFMTKLGIGLTAPGV